ncbi:MAG TPA: outer membrane protein assembly factor BamD [Gemmatimonadales bacterium]|jgi:outer membrane protein assembly factor BamD
MRQSLIIAFAVFAVAACGGRKSEPIGAPSPVAVAASPEEVTKLWQDALSDYSRGKWNDAAQKLERLALEIPPGDSLAVEARFRLAECYYAQKSQLQATREFRRVSDDTPNNPLAPEALLRAGDAFADLWRRPELDPSYGQSALATYQELINRYPNTPAAIKAKLRIADLEENFAKKEFKAAMFYVRLKAWDSSILYLRDLIATYPRSSVAPDALVKLIEIYNRIGYREDATETCGYLRRFHPGTPRTDEVCPVAQ